MRKTEIIDELIKLKEHYFNEYKERRENFSEEYIRSAYLNKVLELFGWNLHDTSEVIQEKIIREVGIRENLNSINSTHTKPDYRLLDREELRFYLDAKNAGIDFLNNKEHSFQIRSYGWSSGLKLSMMSDFENFRVFLTTDKPSIDMAPDYKSITFSINDLIESFDDYSQFLNKETVQKEDWELSRFSLEIQEGHTKSLDDDFIKLISDLQVNLSTGIYESSPNITLDDLQYYVQIIINRLLFHRVLEAIDYEPEARLLNWYKSGDGFWKKFNESCKKDYYSRYDGAMYEFQIPDTIKIDDKYFKNFILNLYGYSPYRFDVIEPEFIAEMYDYFLGKEIFIENAQIKTRNKKTSPSGSVPTPPDFAKHVVENTLNLDQVHNTEQLLQHKILDPCAGSGVFLVTALDKLIEKAKEIEKIDVLSYHSIKLIVEKTLYGVDIDPIAIEVLRMTISLKLILTQHKKPEPIERILCNLTNNFQLGNSIVGNDIHLSYNLSESELFDQIPTDYNDIFPEIMKSGGFTHILTNPPYIEPKHFKSNWPSTYEYLKDRYISNSGKSDISLYFLERVFELLENRGRLGIVIQKRFFKTEYGKKIRTWLAEKGYILEIKEYMDNSLFKFKTTYIAVLYCSKDKNDQVKYFASTDQLLSDRTNLLDIIKNNNFEKIISLAELQSMPFWSFKYFKSLEIISSLKNNKDFETFNSSSRLKVTVGPQVLDKQYYFLRNSDINKGKLSGQIKYKDPVNKKLSHKIVTIDNELGRKIYENEELNSFEDLDNKEITTYIIFPYDDEGKLISLNNLKEKYELTYNYLTWMDKMSTNKRRENPDEFYGYTRVQNITLISVAKIFIPMTQKRVVASLSKGDLFGDNSNINAIVDKYNDINLLKALTVILNSKIFTLLTICIAGEARGGFYKMNKQFIGNVPIPILNNEEKSYLSNLYNDIIVSMKNYKEAYGSKKEYFYRKLKELQIKQEVWVQAKYALKDEELNILKENVDLESIDWLKETRW